MKNTPPSLSRIVLFVLLALAFSGFCLWLGRYWLLLFNLILFDWIVTRRVRWQFWHRYNSKGRLSLVSEWIDAMVFAFLAAWLIRTFLLEAFTIPTASMYRTLYAGDFVFVSKLHYGPRTPITPVAMPFAQHTLPFTESTPSYSTAWQLPYRRLKGFSQIKRNDVIVFNYPEGDTVASLYQSDVSYYQLCKNYGRQQVRNDPARFGEIVYRPLDRRETFVKRCIALPGDTLQIIHGTVYVNGVQLPETSGVTYQHIINTSSPLLHTDDFGTDGSPEAEYMNQAGNFVNLPLTQLQAVAIGKCDKVKAIRRYENAVFSYATPEVFPFSPCCRWTEDNYGPLVIPSRGDTIWLTPENLAISARIITAFEGHTLAVNGSQILIDGTQTDYYIPKLNYYFTLGDNRHNSSDSRYWGFVPEDHVVGKAVLIWLSKDNNRPFPGNIRWNRMMRRIE